ncbi:MAG: hypothetical protein IKU43_11520 [Clostridia bacterium]|nr:hypothetical protein [Clostridia bacterium]
MYTYSIMPLTEKNFDTILADVKEQYEKDISTVPLFKMTLVPEGNPVWDKVGPMCELYARFKKELDKYGVKTGVLVQACLGHGYTITPNPFQRMINLSDGKEMFVCCPEDEGFVQHFCDVLKRIASEHPSAIMLDDDFRIMLHHTMGCACPYHLEKFRRETGISMTREELREYIYSHPVDDKLVLSYLKIQSETLENTAKKFREAVDSVDPTIQGIVCVNGNENDIPSRTSRIFAGKGNPSIARVPNGSYAPKNLREFSNCMSRAAISAAKLRANGVDILIAETDTIPFNRYGKSSRYLHAQYTASLLEGLTGAKHWITRFTLGEYDSGVSHRNILAKHSGFYRKISEYAKNIKWHGVNSRIAIRPYSDIRIGSHVYGGNSWVTHAIERMGIPFYFSAQSSEASFLDGTIVRDMSDEQIEKAFDGSVFVSSDAALDLIERGFGKYLGTDIAEWDLGNVSGESFDGTADFYCTSQKNHKKLIPFEGTEILTYNFLREDEKARLLAPAVTVFDRGGKISVVYCGTPRAEFNYMEGFAFLNETRKKQFITLLKRANALPAYYHGDNEVLFRAGTLPDGRLLAYTMVMSTDPMDELTLYLEKKPAEAKILNPDGSETVVEFSDMGEGIYSFNVRCETCYPAVLLIK